MRRHGIVTFGCLVILGGCGYGMAKIQTSVHLMRLFPPDAKILADYKWLEENLGDLVPMEIVLKIDPEKSQLTFLERMELVEKVQNRLREIPEVGGVLSAITFAPKLPRPEDYKRSSGFSGVFEKLAGVRNKYKLARKVTSQNLEKHRDEYIEGDYLADEDGKELWRISARVGALKDVDYGTFLYEIPKHVQPALDAEFKEKGIPPDSVEAVYTGLVPLVYKAQRSLLDGLILGFISDFILITIVMMIAVRDWSAGLILALPSIFPAVVIFGLMGWLGIIVDIGAVMAPSVALGVTVDDVVHFMIQYRGGLKQGLNRGESVMLAYKGCAQAMYQSWGVIGLGLSVFALSPFTPTQRFGYMMVTLLTSALVGNLLLLPALLAGPLGGLFGRRFTKNSDRQPTSRSPSRNGCLSRPPSCDCTPMIRWRRIMPAVASTPETKGRGLEKSLQSPASGSAYSPHISLLSFTRCSGLPIQRLQNRLPGRGPWRRIRGRMRPRRHALSGAGRGRAARADARRGYGPGTTGM